MENIPSTSWVLLGYKPSFSLTRSFNINFFFLSIFCIICRDLQHFIGVDTFSTEIFPFLVKLYEKTSFYDLQVSFFFSFSI